MAKYFIDEDDYYGWAVFEKCFIIALCVFRSCDYEDCVNWINKHS